MTDDTAQAPAEQPAPATPAAGTTPGAAYRVALDTYSGPLDLLLYLIRKEEVDIYDIPIAHIAEQYQRHIELIAEINVNVAGEFLVMAATLMEIKSRMLLPREEGLEEEEEDPRAELVRQLLEYKRYKDLARELGASAAQQALKFPRPGEGLLPGGLGLEGEAGEEGGELEGIGLWELIDAFAKVLSETTIGPPQTQVLERERPVHEFRRELLRIVTVERRLEFSRIFAECASRDEMIAMFVALLELVRLRQITLQQAGEFGELYVEPAQERESAAPAPAPPPAEAPAAGARPARRPDVLKEVDVLTELEDEEESLGRARARINEALKGADAFLKKHHEQARHEEPPPGSQPEDGEPQDRKGGPRDA